MSTQINFIPINIAVVTISDTRVLDNDKSGDVLEKRVLESNHKIICRVIQQVILLSEQLHELKLYKLLQKKHHIMDITS